MREYNPDIRENDPVYLMRHVEELIKIGTTFHNSSSIIYACLDARIALEILDLQFILNSINPNERADIIEQSKPKNGIDKLNKDIGSLKERYQLFFQAICEIISMNGKFYDFKKSKDLQYKLSTYIHSYYMTQDELNFNSTLMQEAISIINDVNKFIFSLPKEGQSLIVLGIEMKKIPPEDIELLNEWKTSTKFKYEDLKIRLYENLKKRKHT